MKRGFFNGIFAIVMGAFVIYWALTHSPKAGIGQIAMNELSGSYTMSSEAYYISLILGGVIAAIGLLRTYKSMK